MGDDMNVRSRTNAIKCEAAGSSASPPPPPAAKYIPHILMAFALIAAIGVGVYFFAPKKDTSAAAGGRRGGRDRVAAVVVTQAVSEPVPISVRTTGNVQSFSTVNVVPQVSGQLQKVFFTQGQMVKKGDLLFQIDPRQYQALVAQAQGNVDKDIASIRVAQANCDKDAAQIGQMQAQLSKDTASLKYANVEVSRYYKLVSEGAVSREQSDQMAMNYQTAAATIVADRKQIENATAICEADKAQVETAKGTLKVDQAALENAKLQLSWCQIRSPLDGKTGSLQVYEGNVVAANGTTPLVTIAQVHPIYISFTIPEEYLDQVRQCVNQGTLKVEAMIEGHSQNVVSGKASFLEYTVNTTSGTALLRANFDNLDNRLYPGQFVDVVVTMPADGNSIVVPSCAVQTTQQGNSVYVVRPDNTVQLTPVELKRTFNDSAAIGKGINPGDTIVTDGQLGLTPGAKVKIVSSLAAAEAAAISGNHGGHGGSGGGHHYRHQGQ